MAAARRLAWIAGGAAAALAVAIAAFVALPDRAAAPGTPGAPGTPAGSGGSARGALLSDAVAPGAPAGSGGDGGEATRVVASARAEVAAGNLVQARALLTRAYALDPQPAVLLELATVEFQTGHCREARRAAQRVAAEAPGALGDQARQLLGTIGRCD